MYKRAVLIAITSILVSLVYRYMFCIINSVDIIVYYHCWDLEENNWPYEVTITTRVAAWLMANAHCLNCCQSYNAWRRDIILPVLLGADAAGGRRIGDSTKVSIMLAAIPLTHLQQLFGLLPFCFGPSLIPTIDINNVCRKHSEETERGLFEIFILCTLT